MADRDFVDSYDEPEESVITKPQRKYWGKSDAPVSKIYRALTGKQFVAEAQKRFAGTDDQKRAQYAILLANIKKSLAIEKLNVELEKRGVTSLSVDRYLEHTGLWAMTYLGLLAKNLTIRAEEVGSPFWDLTTLTDAFWVEIFTKSLQVYFDQNGRLVDYSGLKWSDWDAADLDPEMFGATPYNDSDFPASTRPSQPYGSTSTRPPLYTVPSTPSSSKPPLPAQTAPISSTSPDSSSGSSWRDSIVFLGVVAVIAGIIVFIVRTKRKMTPVAQPAGSPS